MSQTIEWIGPAGIPQTVTVFAVDPDANGADRFTDTPLEVAEQVAGTEATNRPGLFSAVVEIDATGWHEVTFADAEDAVPLGSGFAKLAGPGTTCRVVGDVVETPDAPPPPAVTLTVLPLTTTRHTLPVEGRCLGAFWASAQVHEIWVYDSRRQPVDMTGQTLKFVLATNRNRIVWTGPATAGGPNGNLLTIETPPEANRHPVGSYLWAVWDENAKEVRGHGSYEIEDVAPLN